MKMMHLFYAFIGRIHGIHTCLCMFWGFNNINTSLFFFLAVSCSLKQIQTHQCSLSCAKCSVFCFALTATLLCGFIFHSFNSSSFLFVIVLSACKEFHLLSERKNRSQDLNSQNKVRHLHAHSNRSMNYTQLHTINLTLFWVVWTRTNYKYCSTLFSKFIQTSKHRKNSSKNKTLNPFGSFLSLYWVREEVFCHKHVRKEWIVNGIQRRWFVWWSNFYLLCRIEFWV